MKLGLRRLKQYTRAEEFSMRVPGLRTFISFYNDRATKLTFIIMGSFRGCPQFMNSSEKLETRRETRPLRLALVGMSGTGKTFWTRQIAEVGVPAVSCDD